MLTQVAPSSRMFSGKYGYGVLCGAVVHSAAICNREPGYVTASNLASSLRYINESLASLGKHTTGIF